MKTVLTVPSTNIPTSVCIEMIPGFGNVYFNLQQRYITISENLQSTYSFDADGRFMSGFIGGINYRRSLESAIMMKCLPESKTKTCRFLSSSEAKKLLDDVLSRVYRIHEWLLTQGETHILNWMNIIMDWNTSRLQAERDAFRAIYKPVSILPPDQYLSVVLQIAEGCSWNQCTFCTFYRERRFRVKSPQECYEHAQHIKRFFGRSIALRKSIFLGDANALIIPQQRLVEILKVINAEFPIGVAQPGYDYVLKGIYSFLDIFGAERKTRDQYAELASYGLKRIYIGLETGDAELFKLLNKPGSPQECIDAVRTIKAAGLQVGIILLAGAGGATMYQQHVEQSLATLSQMGLDSGDIVYISPLVVAGDDAYSNCMNQLGIRALHQPEVLQQVEVIKAGLKTLGPGRPKIALYHIQEFIY